tara:strand:+ start:879 stop:1538 length:660 start_codon:yes stop_codon:yes gene_type:complete
MKQETIKRFLSSIILIPLSFYFIIKGSLFFNIFLILLLLLSIFEWQTLSKNKQYRIPGIFFLFLSFLSAYLLRSGNDELERIFFLILIVCISTDIGGYVFGKIIKGPKLAKISPNKTYAGLIGSYVFSVLVVYVVFNTSNIVNYQINPKNEIISPEILILVILFSSVSQLGDLAISYFKRISKIKNTGKLIPGHGGLLDRIDGMIFTFPFGYLIHLNLI